LRGDVDLERSNLNGFVDDELEEKFIDSLEVWPGWVDLIFLLNTRFRELEV